jgi:hypothetical protein
MNTLIDILKYYQRIGYTTTYQSDKKLVMEQHLGDAVGTVELNSALDTAYVVVNSKVSFMGTIQELRDILPIR